MTNRIKPRCPLFAIIAAAGLCCIEADAQERYIDHVPRSDGEALVQAIQDAQHRESPTTIVINGDYELNWLNTIPPIVGDLLIKGGRNLARIIGAPSNCGALFEVSEGGALTLEGMEFSQNVGGCYRIIVNQGTLTLEEVQFSDNKGRIFCIRVGCRGDLNVVYNRAGGVLEANRVSFVDSGTLDGTAVFPLRTDRSLLSNEGKARLTNVQIYLSEGIFAPLFNNSGSLTLINGSFYSKDRSESSSLIFESGTPGIIEMANTTVAGFAGEWCDRVTSLGHNLVDHSSCSFDSVGDLSGVGADLAWVPVEASWNPRGKEILRYALEPLARSLAVDSGDASYCALGSLLGGKRLDLDGDGSGRAGCDRGAVERVPSTLDQGGVNGLFYNAESDGHYLYISRTDFNIMVMWTTFDAAGKQAWIFGIGDDLSPDGHLVADAYINVNGAVEPDGTFLPAEAQHWGQLEIDMSSCDQGRLQFQSDVPEFGSGEFRFERLATVDQLECVMF